MQLVAYGAQDIYLTGNPQITFFKVVYRRHTNFSMETIKQNISGQSFIGIDNVNNKATVTISRNGDLVTGVFVLAKQRDSNNTVGLCGDSIVEDVEIEIGGQRVDKHFKEWNQIWSELTTSVSKTDGYKYMSGSFNNNLITGGDTKQDMIRYPLNFWFCRNPGLALPLIALQYHEIQMKFTWGVGIYNSSKNDNLTRTSQSLTSQHTVEVWCDYVYLDTDERRRFSQVSHEYLIEQLQIQKEKDVSSESFKINLEHPIKEIIWTTPTDRPMTDHKIKFSINGHDRFYERDKEYFMLEQPYKYHTSIPGYNIKEREDPVLLNESIFSKEYTFQTRDGALDVFGNDDNNNVFNNIEIDDRTSSSSTLTTNTSKFLFISGGSSPNPSMDFKVGDIVRINYFKSETYTIESNGNTNLDPITYWSGTTYDDPNGADVASNRHILLHTPHISLYTETDSEGNTTVINDINLKKKKTDVTPNVLEEIEDTPVDRLGVTVESSEKKVENHVRNLTVLEVFKSNTLKTGKTVYEIKFNDSIGLTTLDTNGDRQPTTAGVDDRVSFEIIARVQNPVSRCSQLKKDIYVYSFSLEPEEHQPSGSCNFSRIDSAKLLFNKAATISNIYAVNYNILRIMSGMGGLAYSS